MGGNMSSLGRNPNPTEVKSILNVILREMFRRADLIDLYSLADPERCSKYVVVASDALKKLFLTINLEPKMGTKGEIYFQKIEGIVKANPMGDQQPLICKHLAFFFIRIFQIYAALTLSIMDSELPAADPVISQKNLPKDKRGMIILAPPELQGFAQKPQARGWFGRGGALTNAPFVPVAPGQPVGSGNYYLVADRAGLYKILNLFLLVPADNAPASTAEMRFQDSDLTIAQDDLYDFGADRAGTRQVKNFSDRATPSPTVMYNFKSGDKFRNIGGRLVLSRDRDQNLDITLDSVSLVDRPGITKTVNGKLNNRRPNDENPVSESGKNLPGLIQELFIKAFEQIEPPTFSAVEFMKKNNIIRALEGSVAIEQTKISINNPKSFGTSRRIPITYRDNFKVDDKSVAIRIMAQLYIDKERKIATSPQEYVVGVDMTGISTDPEKLKSMLNLKKERYRKFSTGDGDNVPPLSERGETISAFLQSVFEDLLKGASEERSDGGITYDKEGRPKPYNSKDVPEEFKIKRLWEALARDPPIKAHCVARAVQLLNVAAIRDPSTGEAYSNVCRVKFPYIKDGTLPTPGQSILTEEGVHAMAMLFVDKLMGPESMPKVTSTPEFAAFRQRLKFSFERYEDLQTTPVPDSLKDVEEKLMPFCEDHTRDRIRVKNALLRDLRAKANQLMQRQGQHISQVMTLIFKLFDERQVRAGALAINPNIMAGGMEAVNKLGEEARGLLINYYGDCEKTYKEGLYAVHNQALSDPTSIEFIPLDAAEPATGGGKFTRKARRT
jgi:hypothetical protein